MTPKISIVITCYNLGTYLNEATASAIEAVKNITAEIIIVNDGSTDKETLIVLKEIEKKHPSIKLLHQQNQGLGRARNNGIALAVGSYIIPLDADNKIRPVFLSKAIEILDSQKDIAVVHGNAWLFGNKEELWQVKPFNWQDMVLNNYIDACAAFRKSVWEMLGGYDTHMPVMGFEDWDFWLRIANKGFSFAYVDEVFFDYRVRDNSMLQQGWKDRPIIIDYIFNKNELKAVGELRSALIENEILKLEPSLNQILRILTKKVKRRLKLS